MFQLKTEFNFLLMNITFSELIMSVFGVPVDFTASLQLGWKLGSEFCRVTGFLLTLLGMYSINIFTAIALYRYIFIQQNVALSDYLKCKKTWLQIANDILTLLRGNEKRMTSSICSCCARFTNVHRRANKASNRTFCQNTFFTRPTFHLQRVFYLSISLTHSS